MIKNKPIINEDPKDALLKQYAIEIQKLKEQIQGNVPNNPVIDKELNHKLK